MSYSILKSFYELIAPRPPPRVPMYPEYDVIEATNEAGEIVILHMPKNYSLSYI